MCCSLVLKAALQQSDVFLSTELIIHIDDDHFVKVHLVIRAILSQCQYRGIWSKRLLYLILLHSPTL